MEGAPPFGFRLPVHSRLLPIIGFAVNARLPISPMNRAKSSLIVVNPGSYRPRNARYSHQAAPGHTAFPCCASWAFLRPIRPFRISGDSAFGFPIGVHSCEFVVEVFSPPKSEQVRAGQTFENFSTLVRAIGSRQSRFEFLPATGLGNKSGLTPRAFNPNLLFDEGKRT